MQGIINRTIEKKMKEISENYPVVMIIGPRQVGKTTLLRYTMEEANINYVSLDELNIRALAIEDPELFLRTYKTPLIIDEFQYAPELLSYIKIVVDNKRFENLSDGSIKENGLFYLTGSRGL